jgi:uncharacterized protein YecE (DUF72 family)
MPVAIRTGASGFSYKEWLGRFYPLKLPANKMLPYYAERLNTVEINYTFRAMPKGSMLEGWAAKTPAEFRFALKAPQRITHFARLVDTDGILNYFCETAGVLGERLGPILFQLPPDFARHDEILEDFIAQLGGRVRAAFEFRNVSWFDSAVFEILRRGGAALCIAESDRLSSPVERTADFLYVRLRKMNYEDAELQQWAARLREIANVREIYVFFKHEAGAPELAIKLRRALEQA